MAAPTVQAIEIPVNALVEMEHDPDGTPVIVFGAPDGAELLRLRIADGDPDQAEDLAAELVRQSARMAAAYAHLSVLAGGGGR